MRAKGRQTDKEKIIASNTAHTRGTATSGRAKKTRVKGAQRKRRTSGAKARASQIESKQEVGIEVNESSEDKKATEEVEPEVKTENAPMLEGLKLGPSLCISEVVEIKAMFDEAAAEDIIIVDSAAVEKVDTAGIQLLLAFQLQAENFGQQVEWKTPSEALTKAAENLGLADKLSFEPQASNK